MKLDLFKSLSILIGENGREEGLALPKLGLNSELYYCRVKGD